MRIISAIIYVFIIGTWLNAYAFDQLTIRTLIGIPVNVTAYTPSKNETDNTPFITASNKKVRAGIVALSRDLERDLKVTFGDFIIIEGIGKYQFQDRTNRRLKRTVDIFMWTKREAMQFGRKLTRIYVME